MKLALSHGAKINAPFKSVNTFNGGQLSFFSGKQDFVADSGLDELIYARVKLFRRQKWRFDEQWYRSDTYAGIPQNTVKKLWKYYHGDDVTNSNNDPLLSIAHTSEGKRVFLSIFCFWITPLHLAIAADHGDMIDELLRHGANVNATGYGNCDCSVNDKPSATNPIAYSCIHLLDCNGTIAERHQALLRGPSLPGYLRMTRSMIAPGSQLVKPVRAARHPHNILHEVLLSAPHMERSARYHKALVDAGHGNLLCERDANGKRPVELAMEKGFDLEIVQVLLGGREDVFVQAHTDGAHGNEACSVLTWAILAGHLQYASYLLPGNPARPRKTLSKYPASPTALTESNFSALHAICSKASEDVDMVAAVAARDGLFPCDTSSTYRSGPENYRKTLLQNILMTNARHQVNKFANNGRTPLSEALAWVAADPFGNIEDCVYVLVNTGANPFAGIEKGLQLPIEVFLELIIRDRNYSILSPESQNDVDHIEKLLTILRGLNLRAAHAQAAGVPQDVFRRLQKATDFLWAPRAMQLLARVRA